MAACEPCRSASIDVGRHLGQHLAAAAGARVPAGLPGRDLGRPRAPGREPFALSHLDRRGRRGFGLTRGGWKLVLPSTRELGPGPQLHRLEPGRTVREAVGQIAAIPIQKDSQVLGTAMTSVGRSLATKIPRGMRAVSLAVSDVTGVSSLVAANNYVDVLATVKLGSGLGASNQRVFVTTLFQNVMVLAVGSDLGEVRTKSPEENAMAALAQQERQRFSTVTLALTPQQAQDLVLTQDIGDITLALRSFRDENETASIPRSNVTAIFGVPEGEVVPRRVPSWQEIRSTAR